MSMYLNTFGQLKRRWQHSNYGNLIFLPKCQRLHTYLHTFYLPTDNGKSLKRRQLVDTCKRYFERTHTHADFYIHFLFGETAAVMYAVSRHGWWSKKGRKNYLFAIFWHGMQTLPHLYDFNFFSIVFVFLFTFFITSKIACHFVSLLFAAAIFYCCCHFIVLPCYLRFLGTVTNSRCFCCACTYYY